MSLPSAKQFRGSLQSLERAALKNETNAYYNIQCAAMHQEIGLAVSSQNAILETLLSMADSADLTSGADSSSESESLSSTNTDCGQVTATAALGDVRLCLRLAYYSGDRRSIDFSAAKVGYRLPAGLSNAFHDMRSEQNRLLTCLSAPAGIVAEPTEIRLAAREGLYYTGRQRYPFRCAFCSGRVRSSDAARASPAELHRLQHPVCPLLMGFCVGNRPADYTDLPRPVQCTEPHRLDFGSASPPVVMDDRPRQPSDTLAYDSDMFGGWARCNLSTTEALAKSKSAAAELASAGLQPLDSRRSAGRQARLQSGCWQAGLVPAWLAAKSGFVVDASVGVARCYACGVTFPNGYAVSGSPCPWLLHARLSPACPHLLRERGLAYIEAVLERFPPIRIQPDIFSPSPSLIDQRRNCRLLCSSTVASATLLFRFDPRAPRARLDLPASLLTARFARAAAECQEAEVVIRLQLAFIGDDFFSAELQLDAALELRRRADECGLGQVASLADDWLAAAKKKQHAAAAEALAADLRCSRCGYADAACCLLPCSHRCLCPTCEGQAADCPVCGSEILAVCLINRA